MVTPREAAGRSGCTGKGGAGWRSACGALLAAVTLVLVSCTRVGVPVSGTLIAPLVTATAVEDGGTATPQGGPPPGISLDRTYAVVWVPEGETLAVREPAGISGAVVGILGQDQRGLTLTGNVSRLGSSVWVEVNRPGGGKGWVNAWNLTEEVPPEAFCGDDRVLSLLAELQRALKEQDGVALAGLASPKRGLVIRHAAWDIDVPLPEAALPELFDNPKERRWGYRRDNNMPIEGTFREVILPELTDVFEASPTISCDNLVSGVSASDVRWPTDLTNLNYYGFYRPAEEGGAPYDWRAWAVGVEYVDGEPFIAILVQFQGEI